MSRRRIIAVLSLALWGASATATAAQQENCSMAGVMPAPVASLMCKDPELHQLDQELDRLLELASTGPKAGQRSGVKAEQRRWITASQEDCVTNKDMRTCLRDNYLFRIAEVRREYPDVRREDDQGISIGPHILKCPGLYAPAKVTLLHSTPGAAALIIGEEISMLTHMENTPKGVRYVDASHASEGYIYVLIRMNDGNTYKLTRPREREITCTRTRR